MALLQPPELARDITIPEPGSTTARDVLSRALGRLLREIQVVHRLAPPAARHEAATLARLVSAMLRGNPGALTSALRSPSVAGPLRCLRNAAAEDRQGLFVDLLAQLAFELAAHDALPEPVRLERWPAHVVSIRGRRSVALPRDLPAVVIENGARGLGVVEDAYSAISGEIVLARVDTNPLALVEAHPDKAGNALDLGGHEVAAWVEALAAAFAPIEEHLPEIRREMDLLLSQIVPVGYDAERHLSASYQEIIGTLYLTLHPSRMTLSEALIHEFSHNKLNALVELDPLLENAFSPLYTSPVRPDPRPLHGVLLAVHAFLPVARLYEQMIAGGAPEAKSDAFHARFAAIRKINREGAELLLREARPTPLGRVLLDEIRRWHEHYARYEDAP